VNTRDIAFTAAWLDELLCSWHQWARTARVTRGFNERATVLGDTATSRQYDDMNGALDADLDELRMRQVDFEVSEMRDPHKAAIHVLARALTFGTWVFLSPRMPACPLQRAALVDAARVILTGRLIAAGLTPA